MIKKNIMPLIVFVAYFLVMAYQVLMIKNSPVSDVIGARCFPFVLLLAQMGMLAIILTKKIVLLFLVQQLLKISLSAVYYCCFM